MRTNLSSLIQFSKIRTYSSSLNSNGKKRMSAMGGLEVGAGGSRTTTTIAVCQMNCTNDKQANLRQALELLKEAKQKNAEMVFYPEGFDFIGDTKEETIRLAETLEGPIIKRYQQFACEFQLWISLGGFHQKMSEDDDRLSNSHILIDPKGQLVSLYKKMHLFDVEIPEQKLKLRESDFVNPGTIPILSPDTPIGRIGLGVCYDIRFPEFSAFLRKEGAEVLTYPSAFTVHTGKSHWEVLLRARAIENQCFVIAAAQCGQHNHKRASYGHSMVIDPWGVILASIPDGLGVVCADIDLNVLNKIRREMPVISHKRPELSSGGASFSIPSREIGDQQFSFGQVKVKYSFVFLETQLSRAFVNKHCVVPGHVLVTSKRVVERIGKLTSAEMADLFLLVQKTQGVMENVHGVSSSTMAIQDGKDSGQTIRHVHVHILPRKPKDFSENDNIYEELVTHDKGPDVKWRVDSDMQEEANQIRNYIQQHFQHILN